MRGKKCTSTLKLVPAPLPQYAECSAMDLSANETTCMHTVEKKTWKDNSLSIRHVCHLLAQRAGVNELLCYGFINALLTSTYVAQQTVSPCVTTLLL